MKESLRVLLSLTIVLTFAGATSAVDYSLYGSARIATFWIDGEDGGLANIAADINDTAGSVGGEDETLQWDIQGNSRLGGKAKAGDVSGQFEFGIDSTTVTNRILWGEWKFGAGSLGVGQRYVPVNSFISGQAFLGDQGLLATGAAYGGRRPMIRLKFGAFEIAAINVHAETDLGTGGDVDVIFPKVEAAYELSSNMFYAKAFGGYQTYSIDDIGGAGGASIDVTSFIIGAHAGVNAGPFGAAVTGFFGQNLGRYGLLLATNGSPRVNATGNDTNDNDTWGAAMALSYKATDKVRLEVGYGMVQSELDQTTAGVNDNEDDAQQYYAQCLFTLAKGVFFLPEIGVLDFKDNFAGTDQGKVTYAGAKWQIDF